MNDLQRILRLRADTPEIIEYADLHEDGTFSTPMQTAWDQLPHLGNQPRTLLIVPTQNVLLTQVDLPHLSAAQKRQAAPFALEDQLATPIEQLHFAFTPLEKDTLPVAVIKTQYLETWRAACQKAHLNLTAVLADCLLLPWEEDHWTLWISAEEILVRTGLHRGFAIDRSAFEPFILQALAQNDKPAHIHLYQPEENPLTLPRAFKDIPTTEMSLDSQVFFTPLASWQAALDLNLLQGAFRPKHKKRLPKAWRLPANLTLAFIGLMVASALFQPIFFSFKNKKLADAITLQYQTLLPAGSTPETAQTLVEQKLQRLERTATGSHFLTIIGHVALIDPKVHGIKIEHITYSNDTLNLMLQADTLKALNDFKKQLANKNMQVSHQVTNRSGKKITAQMSITT